MPDLASYFASGRAVDVVLVILVAEAAWLIWRGRGQPLDIIVALLPGAFILLGVRAALVDAPWPQVALWLALSLPAHAADIARRRW